MNSSILDHIRKARQSSYIPMNPLDVDTNTHTVNFKQSYDNDYDDVYEAKKIHKTNGRSQLDFDEKTVDTMNEASLPVISEKTKQMLDKIKAKRIAAVQTATDKESLLRINKTNEVSSSIDSRTFLYREFDIELRVKVLPNNLIDLYYFMKEYDAAINLLYIRKRPPFYKDIRDIVRHALCKENTVQDFGKVLTIAPSLYKFKWVMDERTKSYDLLIEMNYETEDNIGNFRYFSSQKLKERQKLFYFGLIEFLTDHTNIKQLIPNIKDSRKDEFSIFENIDMAFDHSMFFSNNMSQTNNGEKLVDQLKEFKEMPLEVPVYEFPPNPGRELRSGKELLDFKKPSLITKKTRIIDQLREKGLISAKSSSSSKTNENESIAVRQQKIEDLKAKLLQKVKENAKRVETCIKQEKVEFVEVNRDLREMIEQLHVYYNKRNVESMFYPNVLKYLEKNYYKEYTLDDLDKLVKMLLERLPDWITRLIINQQDILRVKQGFNIKLLVKEFS